MKKEERMTNVRLELKEILTEFFRAFAALLITFLIVATLFCIVSCETPAKIRWGKAREDIYEFEPTKNRLYTTYEGKKYYLYCNDPKLRDMVATDESYMWDLLDFRPVRKK